MYAYIYKEIFVNNYQRKNKITDRLWNVSIGDTDFLVEVWLDYNEFEEDDYKPHNEAYLKELEPDNNLTTYDRLNGNRRFLASLLHIKNIQPYLFIKPKVVVKVEEFSENPTNELPKINQLNIFGGLNA